MRNVSLATVDHLDHDVLPIATDYPDRHVLPRHRHRRAQVLHAASGIMQVQVEDAVWTVPVAQAVLIPPETDHQVRFDGASTLSLYVEPRAVPWWPPDAMVVEVGPLLRALLVAAADLDIPLAHHGRDHHLVALVLAELERAAPMPLHLALPTEPRLRELCLRYLDEPGLEDTNRAWATEMAMSPRSLERYFLAATGMSPGQWRTRARMLAAIRLLPQHNVTATAAMLGYATPAAFTASFTQTLGVPPTRYRRTGGAG